MPPRAVRELWRTAPPDIRGAAFASEALPSNAYLALSKLLEESSHFCGDLGPCCGEVGFLLDICREIVELGWAFSPAGNELVVPDSEGEGAGFFDHMGKSHLVLAEEGVHCVAAVNTVRGFELDVEERCEGRHEVDLIDESLAAAWLHMPRPSEEEGNSRAAFIDLILATSIGA